MTPFVTPIVPVTAYSRTNTTHGQVRHRPLATANRGWDYASGWNRVWLIRGAEGDARIQVGPLARFGLGIAPRLPEPPPLANDGRLPYVTGGDLRWHGARLRGGVRRMRGV